VDASIQDVDKTALRCFLGGNFEAAVIRLPLRGALSPSKGTHDSQFVFIRNAVNVMTHKPQTSVQKRGLGLWSHEFLNATFMFLHTSVLNPEGCFNYAIEWPVSSRGAAKHRPALNNDEAKRPLEFLASQS